jgi:hypothetical protein
MLGVFGTQDYLLYFLAHADMLTAQIDLPRFRAIMRVRLSPIAKLCISPPVARAMPRQSHAHTARTEHAPLKWPLAAGACHRGRGC